MFCFSRDLVGDLWFIFLIRVDYEVMLFNFLKYIVDCVDYDLLFMFYCVRDWFCGVICICWWLSSGVWVINFGDGSLLLLFFVLLLKWVIVW